MRSNIRDIIKATNCSEDRAADIENEINNQWLLDWSECTMAELFNVAKKVEVELNINANP